MKKKKKKKKSFKIGSIVILFNQVLYVDKMKNVGHNF